MYIDFESLVGKTLVKIEEGHDEILMKDSDGNEYKMYHDQDCCESVTIESIDGDLQDLIGLPITLAEAATNQDGPIDNQYDESFTWTFYKIGNVKATIVIRWYGSSNGYYSESVSFVKL